MEPFQSTRPARGATTAGADGAARRAVSIHAPRAGRDEYADTLNKVAAWFQSTRPARGATPVLCGKHYGSNVSIHAPRAGRDAAMPPDSAPRIECFNPRAPRGARREQDVARIATRVSIHAPRAGRDRLEEPLKLDDIVSIHAPRAGRDLPGREHSVRGNQFQSTRPARGATLTYHQTDQARLRFNPRAPRGARR